jgi:hypothetical protein
MPPLRSLLGLGRLAGGLAGGGIGAATAGPDEDPILRGLGGAALGGLAIPGAVGAAARGYMRRPKTPTVLPGSRGPRPASAWASGQGRRQGGKRGGLSEAITDYTYFGFLGSPDTMARATMGAVGGAFAGAMEMFGEGLLKMDTDLIKKSGRVIGYLGNPNKGARDWWKYVTSSPEKFTEAYKQVSPRARASDPEQYMRGEDFIGRFFGASDLVANKALQAGGMHSQEAARYTLTGDPASTLGKGIIDTAGSWREAGGVKGLAMSQIMPFARVGVMGLEKGLEHVPGIGFLAHQHYRNVAKAAAKKAAKGGSPSPGSALNKPRAASKAVPEASWQKKLTQQAMGLGAGMAGYQGRDQLDPRLSLVLGPAAGPAFVPYIAGRELRQQEELGRSAADPRWLMETLRETSPLGAQPAGILYNFPTEAPRRLIPSAVSDIAEAMDPAFSRKRGGREVEEAVRSGEIPEPTFGTSPTAAALQSRIPWMREQLPEEFMPTDVFGDPRWPADAAWVPEGPGGESNNILRALSRMMAPSRESVMPATLKQTDPRQAIFRDLGLQPGAPSTRVEIPGTGVPLQHTPESSAAVSKYRGFARRLAANLLSQMPQLQQMLEGPRKQVIAQQLFEQLQRRISQSLAAGTLPTALSQGATVPPFLAPGRPAP